jgi:hypothetical protein
MIYMDEHLRKVDHCGKLKSFDLEFFDFSIFLFVYCQSKLRSGTCHYAPLSIDILISEHGAFLEGYLHQVRLWTKFF